MQDIRKSLLGSDLTPVGLMRVKQNISIVTYGILHWLLLVTLHYNSAYRDCSDELEIDAGRNMCLLSDKLTDCVHLVRLYLEAV